MDMENYYPPRYGRASRENRWKRLTDSGAGFTQLKLGVNENRRPALVSLTHRFSGVLLRAMSPEPF
jgi:hypothetical protein